MAQRSREEVPGKLGHRSDISDGGELGQNCPFLGFFGGRKIFPLVGLGCEVSPSAQTPSKVNLFGGVLTHNSTIFGGPDCVL